MKHFKFPCGCKFPILSENPLRLKFVPDIEQIPLTCKRTWDLLSEESTVGCFQLESRLGQTFAKKLKPRNLEHLSALVAILRPGALESLRDEKSITQHYIDRKNGEEEVTYYHPALEPILQKTYGEMIYQEQAMRIATDIAGFDPQQANTLRKAIGKKKPELMSKLKSQFIDGCVQREIVTPEQAEEIFSWIEKSQRYSFNASHSLSYAMNTYLSAYAKAHFPRVFFTSYLYYAKDKVKPQEEVNELANNAKFMGIEIRPPDLRHMNEHFALEGKDIYFGLTDIKGIGKSIIKRLHKELDNVKKKLKKNVDEMTWLEFVVFLSPNINSTAVKNLISSGAVSYLCDNRSKMLYEFEMYGELSQREQRWCESILIDNGQPITMLLDLFKKLVQAPTGKNGGCANKKRLLKIEGLINSLEKPPYKLVDSKEWIAGLEDQLLGISLTCASVESCDISAANCTCKEFLLEKNKSDVMLIAGLVDKVNEIKTKTGTNPGQLMAFVTFSDNSGCINSGVCFPDSYLENKRLLVEGNHVMLRGIRGKQKDSFIINKVFQI